MIGGQWLFALAVVLIATDALIPYRVSRRRDRGALAGTDADDLVDYENGTVPPVEPTPNWATGTAGPA